MSALLTGEEGEITMGNPDFLYFLYKLGMRMMTLTWNYETLSVFQMSDWIRNRLLLPTDTA